MENDQEAWQTLLMFQGILNIQSEQGVESFSGMVPETIKAIDKIQAARYSGCNKNIINGFVAMKNWFEGLELLKKELLMLDK